MTRRQEKPYQKNSLGRLASYVAQVHACRGNFGFQEHANEILMAPNCCNINALENCDSERATVLPAARPSNSTVHIPLLDETLWNKDYYNNLLMEDSSQANQLEIFPTKNTQEEHMMGPQQNIDYPINQAEANYYPVSDYLPSDFESIDPINPRLEPTTLLKEKEVRKVEEEEKMFDVLEDVQEIIDLTNPNLNVSLRHPTYLVFGHIAVEDVYGISNLNINFNCTERFFNFVENYVIEHSSKKYEKYRPGTTNDQFSLKIDKSDENIKTVKLLRVKSNSPIKLNDYGMPLDITGDMLVGLTEGLLNHEQYSDVIRVAKNSFSIGCNRLDDTDNARNNYVFHLTDAYLHEHCFYQACQTLFLWLKNDPYYKNVVPPNFIMENKTETALDKIQLRTVIIMFLTAARRHTDDPNPRIQIALSKLFQMDQNYDKSVECCQYISKREMDYKPSAYIWMCLGNSLALANRPNEAIAAFKNIKCDERLGIKAMTNIGLIYLNNEEYGLAAIYLFSAVDKQMILGYQGSDDASLENSWSRLRLLFDLMRRYDLCQAVDNRDKLKIMQYLYG